MDRYAQLLCRCALHTDSYDPDTLAQITLAQVHIALYGGKSALALSPSFLRLANAHEAGAGVAVAVCTEREIKTALVEGDTCHAGEGFPLPGASYPAPLGDLIFAAAELLAPLLKADRPVVLVLPFALSYEASGAVYVQRLPTALRFSAWEGLDLQTTLRDELASRGFAPSSLRICSSVIAAQFGALPFALQGARTMALYWDDSVDASFTLPDFSILKLRTGDNALQAVSYGAGALCSVPAGVLDLSMDRDSLRPGEDLQEKLVSLRYLGEVYRLAMIRAIEERLLSFMCGREFLSLRKLSAAALLSFLAKPDDDAQTLSAFTSHDANDRKLALYVGEAVLQRALQLLLGNLLSLLSMTGAGQSESAPANIALGGAGFENDLLYTRFEALVRRELGDVRKLHYTLVRGDDLLFTGAAQCLLRNP